MSCKPKLVKFGLLATLYIFQFLPIAFFFQALPVFLRQQGVSLEAIGLTNLVALPWMLKFLWSPLVDRYGWTKWGHYKSWILAMQSLLAVTLSVCAMLNVQANFSLLLVCLLLVCLWAATQDIATDALAIGFLDESDRGIGNGIQNAGGYLGFILGGGGMLILLNRWGWKASLLMLAALMLLALIPVVPHKERIIPAKTDHPSFKALVNFCRRPGMCLWLLILVLYPLGDSMANAMFKPLLVDIGLSLEEIGWLLGVVSAGIGILGALAAGFLINPLGRKRSLIVFGVMQTIAVTAYILPTVGVTNLPALYLVGISSALSHSMANTALFTVMMDESNLETAGTDYTLQTAAYIIGHMG
ncbi:MFS transporter, partial [Fischerella thermalis CCMEE 5319]